MEIALDVVGAFDRLASATVTDDQLLAELQRRGLSEADSRLAIDKAVTEGLLLRGAEGTLGKSAEESRRVRGRNDLEPADD